MQRFDEATSVHQDMRLKTRAVRES
jgi:hypothetical protein